MAKTDIRFYRKTASEINMLPIMDGKLYFETDQGNNGKIFLDNGTTRLQIGGNFLSDYEVTFNVGDWSSVAPYTQTVTVNGIKEIDKPIPTLNVESATSEANRRNMQLNYNYIWSYIIEDESITAVANYNKPLMDLKVNFRGN